MAKKNSTKKTKAPYVGIVGMGYVGLPLAREFVRGGAKVLGFDVNSKMVAKVNCRNLRCDKCLNCCIVRIRFSKMNVILNVCSIFSCS